MQQKDFKILASTNTKISEKEISYFLKNKEIDVLFFKSDSLNIDMSKADFKLKMDILNMDGIKRRGYEVLKKANYHSCFIKDDDVFFFSV